MRAAAPAQRMATEPPSPQLDYWTPPPRARWSWKKRVCVTLAVLGGVIVLFYLGVCVAFVREGFSLP